jgi:hypothetical protein
MQGQGIERTERLGKHLPGRLRILASQRLDQAPGIGIIQDHGQLGQDRRPLGVVGLVADQPARTLDGRPIGAAPEVQPGQHALHPDLGRHAPLRVQQEARGGRVVVELEQRQGKVAGAPRPGMPPDSRGFIGVGVRTGAHGVWSEVFYLRPTNGRADDQLRRNHAVQYASDPESPWHRLRKESPGVYESYADMEAGAWTTMRIDVAGTTAQLYVNGAAQPSPSWPDDGPSSRGPPTPGRVGYPAISGD